MSNTKKNALYSLFLLALMGAVWLYRSQITPPPKSENQTPLFSFQGKTMGTTYTVKYLADKDLNLKSSTDSILKIFNQSLSTYISDSEISQFNQRDSLQFKLPYLYPILEKSVEIHEVTNGAFDPTVMPLVNAWGFGPEKRAEMPQNEVDSLLKLIGFSEIQFDNKNIQKLEKNIQLDFSALAKGYGVDVVAQFLETQNIENYLVEIGGETICKGLNNKNLTWKIGIDNPKANEDQKITGIVQLQNRAIATSGNYRNFYIRDGKKYAHTISPKTGYPVEHSLLSASVFAPDCMTADAYATAFMVAGTEMAKTIAEKMPELDVFLIYEEEGKLQTYASKGIQEFIEIPKN